MSSSPIKLMRAYEDCRTVNVVYSDKILGLETMKFVHKGFAVSDSFEIK